MSFRYAGGFKKPSFNPLAAQSNTVTYYLYAWGGNYRGQQGSGDQTRRSSPTQVGSQTYWSKLSSAGEHVLALDTTGRLWSWGRNDYGQLGLSNATDYSSPKQVGSLTTWSSISAAIYSSQPLSAAIKTDGTLWTWGRNFFGGLGLGNTTNYQSPKQVGALTNWRQVLSGGNYCLAIKTNGTLWSWGANGFGQLGDSTTTNRSSPVQVGALSDWLSVNTSNQNPTHILAIKTNGTIWAWGTGHHGQLGIGNLTYYSSPKQIGALTNWASTAISNAYSSMAVKTDGTLWTWGQNYSGELGHGHPTNRYSSPKQVGSLTTWLQPEAGSSFRGCTKTDGTLWMWGANGSGQLGLGNTTYYSSPKQVGSSTYWNNLSIGETTVHALDLAAAINTGTQYSGIWKLNSHSVAKAAGTWPDYPQPRMFSWGSSSYGELGLGNTTTYSSPKQVGSLTNWYQVAAGSSQAAAIKTDGTIWTWGRNNIGQLGLGTTSYSSLSPNQVGALTTWSYVAVATHTAAIKTDGTMWVWGSGGSGGHGLGDRVNRSSPVQLGALTTWLTATAGTYRTIAITTAGALYAWGSNDTGVLGLGNTTYYSSPKQVGSLTNWSKVAIGQIHTISVKTDGTLWTWGDNSYGQIGDGTRVAKSSPVQIGSLTTWAYVAASSASSAAIKTDGTLWTWGSNLNGNLGLSNLSSYSSPKQVGSLTNWSKIDGGSNNFYLAIKTDGTLWAWGQNTSGKLGTNNSTEFSSPVQVGALTTWTSTSSHDGFTLGLATA